MKKITTKPFNEKVSKLDKNEKGAVGKDKQCTRHQAKTQWENNDKIKIRYISNKTPATYKLHL